MWVGTGISGARAAAMTAPANWRTNEYGAGLMGWTCGSCSGEASSFLAGLKGGLSTIKSPVRKRQGPGRTMAFKEKP